MFKFKFNIFKKNKNENKNNENIKAGFFDEKYSGFKLVELEGLEGQNFYYFKVCISETKIFNINEVFCCNTKPEDNNYYPITALTGTEELLVHYTLDEYGMKRYDSIKKAKQELDSILKKAIFVDKTFGHISRKEFKLG